MILYDSSNAYYDNYISTVEKILRTFKISTPNYEGIRCQTMPIPIAESPSLNTSNSVTTQTIEKKNSFNDSGLKSIMEKAQESMKNR